MKKFFFDCGTRDVTASTGILALRVLVASMMLFGHGLPKLREYSASRDLFPVPDFFPLSLMSPQVSLIATITAEFGAALLIILGLATRPAAFLLGFTMVVAVFEIKQGAPWFVNPPTVYDAKELGLMYLIPMIAIILSGAGLFSLDSLLYKESKRRRW